MPDEDVELEQRGQAMSFAETVEARYARTYTAAWQRPTTPEAQAVDGCVPS